MKRILLSVISIAFWLILLVSVSAAAIQVDNTVTIADPNTQILHVVTIIKGINQPQLQVALPVWTPGHYAIEDYARNLSHLIFTNQSGQSLYHQKIKDSTWVIETRGASETKIEYDYLANSYSTNRSKITPTYALLNGSNFFFYLPGHTTDVPATVTFKLPDGWQIATGMPAAANPNSFTAENFDALADCPFLAGQIDYLTFQLRGVEHHLAIAPKGIVESAVLDKYSTDTMKMIDTQISVFREIPYKSYTAINVFAEDGIGALEHSNSYVAIVPKQYAKAESINVLISSTAHEFFHAYNVKRIRPAEMFPYRYNERNYTPLLWVSEGITSYYTTRGMLRAGFVKREDYLPSCARLLSQVQSDPAAGFISVEEASISTWLDSLPSGDSRRFTVDYYSRGSVIGLLLDLSIRHDTNNRASLDDVMRSLYSDYYKKNKGFTTADLVGIINRITGKDYNAFFKKYVGGTEPLPYDEVLSYAGLKLQSDKRQVVSFGFRINGNKTITTVIPGGVGEAAGAKIGDVLLGVGNFNVGQDNWIAEFRKYYQNRVGETATMYVLRDGKPVYLTLKIALEEVTTWKLEQLPNPDKLQQDLLNGWREGQ